MEDTKKTPAELVADLMLDPGFVLVPQDRYEELIRAETERDVLEATIKGENSYQCRKSSRCHSAGAQCAVPHEDVGAAKR